MLLLRVMTYVVLISCFGIELVFCDLYLTRLDLTRICYLTLSSLMFLTNSVVVITRFVNSFIFNTTESVD